MKKKISSSVLLLVSLFIHFVVFSQHKPQKHALIFAVSNFINKQDWESISSDKDAMLVKKALLKQQFPTENIKIVQDKNATKNGMLNEINKLTNRIEKGDIVFLHFSTHGEQIADVNRDSIIRMDELDGYDEALVPYDAGPINSPKFDKVRKSYLVDDELRVYVNTLRSKLGSNGDLLITIDACHSGSATRGLSKTNKIRGGRKPIVPQDYDYSGLKPRDESLFEFNQTSTAVIPDMSPYIVIAGSDADQLNSELTDKDGKSYGSLSFLISHFFSTYPNTSYRALYSWIKKMMKKYVPNQTPTIEGSELDKGLWGGDYKNQQFFYQVYHKNKNTVKIKGGTINGLIPRTEIVLCNAGTISTDDENTKILGKGKIIRADATTADAELSFCKTKDITNTWAFVSKNTIDSLTFKFNIRNGKDDYTINEENLLLLKRTLKDSFPGIEFVSNQTELNLSYGEKWDSLWIGPYFYRLVTAHHLPDLIEALRTYQKFIRLKNTQTKGSEVKLNYKLEVLNKKQKKANTTNSKKDISYKKWLSDHTINIGDNYKIWLSNQSDKRLYIALLDLQVDGVVNILFPKSTQNKSSLSTSIYPEDAYIEPNEIIDTFLNIIYRMNPPAGMDTYKLMVSDEPFTEMELWITKNFAHIKRFRNGTENNQINPTYDNTDEVIESMKKIKPSKKNKPYTNFTSIINIPVWIKYNEPE